MQHLSYLFLDMVIGIPAFIVLFFFHKKTVMKHKAFFVSCIIMATIAYFIIDPVGVAWGAWGYNAAKVLGMYPIGGSVIEELFLAWIDIVLVGIVVLVFASREEKKKPFWPFF